MICGSCFESRHQECLSLPTDRGLESCQCPCRPALWRRDPPVPPVPAPEPAREARHFLGVTTEGLRVGVVIEGVWRSEPVPFPLSALGRYSDVSDLLLSDLAAAREGTEPMLWPVSLEVYREFHEAGDDEDHVVDSDEDVADLGG